jgi:hypothetical protein
MISKGSLFSLWEALVGNRKWSLLLVSGFILGCGGADKGVSAPTGAPAPTVIPNGAPIVLRAQGTLKVTVLPIKSSDYDALVRVNGVESDITDITLPARVEKRHFGRSTWSSSTARTTGWSKMIRARAFS